MSSYKNCTRCGYIDHTTKLCKNLRTSFGLIVYKYNRVGQPKGRMYKINNNINCNLHKNHYNYNKNSLSFVDNELLFFLVERKDTIGYLNILQGLYSEHKIVSFFKELSCHERFKLKHTSFLENWNSIKCNKKDVSKYEAKFNKLNINDMIDKNQSHYRECDYLIPKGKIKQYESMLECAVREFCEESGYSENQIMIRDTTPYEEIFYGIDGKQYKNVYFVAEMDSNATVNVKLGDDPNQEKEVGNMGWFNILECELLIRPNHIRKIEILKNVYSKINYDINQRVYQNFIIAKNR